MNCKACGNWVVIVHALEEAQDKMLCNRCLVTTLRRELEEAKHRLDQALVNADAQSFICNVYKAKLEPALACCNAFLDAEVLADNTPIVEMRSQDHDKITPLALKATGRGATKTAEGEEG